MVKTLLQLALDFVGNNQKIFKCDSITSLPYHIQEKFLPYLSAHDLFELTSKDGVHLNRKVIDHIWNLHVQRRWSRSKTVMNIFHESGFNENPKLVYLQKYFWEILSYCSINLNTVDPISLFHCPLHKMNRPWPSDAVVKDSKDLTLHRHDLLKFSIYAETLTIIGSQCSWICENEDLLNAIKRVTKILQIQSVNDTYCESIKFLLQSLINEGKLTHAVFSMIRLTRKNLRDLMQICAGIQFVENDEKAMSDTKSHSHLGNICLGANVVNDRSEPSLIDECIPSVPYANPSGPILPVNGEPILTFDEILEDDTVCQEMDPYCLDLDTEKQEFCSNCNDKCDQPIEEGEIDLFDEAVKPIPSTEPSVYREIILSDGTCVELKGLKIFAVLNAHSHCKEDFESVLVEVLPYWNCLTKLAIFDADAESEEIMNQLVKKLETHQLTHLVIDDANVHQTFYERLIQTFRDHYRSEEECCKHKPLELLDFQGCLKSLCATNFVPFHGPICGIQKLDLSITTILDSGFSLLLELLRNDRALKHLKLNGCFLKEDQVVQLLSVLTERCQIETLGLSGNRVIKDEVEIQLLKFIKNNKKLQTLILNYSRLRCEFVDSEEFINAVMTHPNLKELSIKNNHLKNTVCNLLKVVCCSQKSPTLKNLNIGYNWVKGADLLETAKEIISYRESHQITDYALDFLCLSGNRLHLSDNSQCKLWMVFNDIVKDLEVDRIDYDRPFDEHLAQV